MNNIKKVTKKSYIKFVFNEIVVPKTVKHKIGEMGLYESGKAKKNA